MLLSCAEVRERAAVADDVRNQVLHEFARQTIERQSGSAASPGAHIKCVARELPLHCAEARIGPPRTESSRG